MADTLISVRSQVNSFEPLLLVIPTIGGTIFSVIAILSVAVQPLSEVTVTVYVPGVSKVLFAVVCVEPPLHV